MPGAYGNSSMMTSVSSRPPLSTSTSSYRLRSSAYLTAKNVGSYVGQSRSSSLDRSFRDYTSPSYRPSSSHQLTSTTSFRTMATGSSRVTGGYLSAGTTSSPSSFLDTTSTHVPRRMDLTSTIDIKARLSKFDFSTTLRSNSLRVTGMTTKRDSNGCDAIHDDDTSSPVLTNYRHLGETGSLNGSDTRSGTKSSLCERRFGSRLNGGRSLELDLSPAQAMAAAAAESGTSRLGSSKTDSDSGLSVSCSSSSSSGSSSPSLSTGSARSSGGRGKLSLDENSNRTYLRYKYDANHNLCSGGSSKASSDDDSSTDACKTTGTASSRHSRFSSSDGDVPSYSYGRRRRNSGQANSTSGYSSDASSSSSNGSPLGPSIRREKHESGGLVGLRNLGNTCFMNSVLQCLSNTKPLLEYCLRENYISDINSTVSSMKGALIKAFASLLQTMWKADSGDAAINPQAFKSQIQKFAPRFMGYSQQDAQEFLRYLLQGLHEDVNRVISKPTSVHSDIDDNLSDNQKATESWRRYLRFDDSKIVDLFVGQLKSTLRCTVCGHASVTFDPFWDLSLPMPKTAGSVRLNQCFELFTREEVLDGDEKPTCSRCKTRRKCTKSFTIQKFPKILVIHLKRFSPNEKYKAKLTTTVDFPLHNLDLSSYATNSNRGQNCVYNLYGVSNHSGTVYTGHYTAFCKNPYSNEWHDFNDGRVSKVTGNIASSEAYVLFYEQVSHSSRL